MSRIRIRNRIRFQSPEERLLNGLLVVVLITLIAAGVWKLRDHPTVATTEVRGIQVTRTDPVSSSRAHRGTTTSTTTTTTTTPSVIWFGYVAPGTGPATKPTTPTSAPFFGFPPSPTTTTTTLTTTTTTRPRPTTTTTRPRPTTTTSTTTTTTKPPVVLG